MKKITVNCCNQEAVEKDLTQGEIDQKDQDIIDALAEEQARTDKQALVDAAIGRLQIIALTDETIADLLLVLGYEGS